MTDQTLTLDTQQPPTLDDIRRIGQWLNTHDHGVVIWTPDELGEADITDVENAGIEAGWQVIFESEK